MQVDTRSSDMPDTVVVKVASAADAKRRWLHRLSSLSFKRKHADQKVTCQQPAEPGGKQPVDPPAASKDVESLPAPAWWKRTLPAAMRWPFQRHPTLVAAPAVSCP